jgi:transcriptional regulator with XRE-family HTH domain
MSDRASFDAAAFFAALDAQRQARHLLWKDVAAEAKISPSTLTRLAQGKRPDVDSLAALLDWSGLSADQFIVGQVRHTEPEPLAMISTYLRADRNLSPQAAEALEQVVKATYDVLKRGDGGA